MCDWTSQGIPVRRPSNRTVSEHMDAFAAHVTVAEDNSYGVVCEDLKIAWEITGGMATAKRSERKGVGHWGRPILRFIERESMGIGHI